MLYESLYAHLSVQKRAIALGILLFTLFFFWGGGSLGSGEREAKMCKISSFLIPWIIEEVHEFLLENQKMLCGRICNDNFKSNNAVLEIEGGVTQDYL